MFEHRNQPLVPRGVFLGRLARFTGIALAVVAGSLGFGILGYHFFAGLPWIDALLNAAMLLGGMGPVDAPHTTAGKLFAAFYALYAGIVFLVVAGLLVAPVLHRFLHRFHVEMEDEGEKKDY
jgi:hypothetical protein